MKNQNLDWTTEIRSEFYKNTLDNYNLFETLEDATRAFINNQKDKLKNGGKNTTEFNHCLAI